MMSGVRPFRQVCTGRQLLLPYRINLQNFHKYWPAMIEKDEIDRKRIERIKWLDEREKRLARRKKK